MQLCYWYFSLKYISRDILWWYCELLTIVTAELVKLRLFSRNRCRSANKISWTFMTIIDRARTSAMKKFEAKIWSYFSRNQYGDAFRASVRGGTGDSKRHTTRNLWCKPYLIDAISSSPSLCVVPFSLIFVRIYLALNISREPRRSRSRGKWIEYCWIQYLPFTSASRFLSAFPLRTVSTHSKMSLLQNVKSACR